MYILFDRRGAGTMALLRRTAEQEARFRVLSRDASIRVFRTEELAEWHRLQVMAAYDNPMPVPDFGLPGDAAIGVFNAPQMVADPLPAPPPRIRISVRVGPDPRYESNRGYWRIEVTVNGNQVDIPDKDIIRGFLPQGDKSKIQRGRRWRNVHSTLSNALNSGLSPQALHDALKAWAVAANTPVPPASSEFNLDDDTSYLLHAQPATLEVGGKVFRLVPAGEVDVRPLIKRVRIKALASAKAEAVTITSKAKVDARLVVSSAENSAASIRAEVETLRREIANQLPTWVKVTGRPVMWIADKWWVGINVQCKVKEIRLTIQQWNTVFYWNAIQWPIGMNEENRRYYFEAHPMRLWVRLNPGWRYTLDDVRHFRDGFSTTHTSTDRVCMNLQGLPTTLVSPNDLTNLEKGISRGMLVVNLNSPLSRDYTNYYPDFKGQIPDVVRKWLVGTIAIGPTRTNQSLASWREINPGITWDRTESLVEEGAGTFNTDNYVPTPPPTVNEQAMAEVADLIMEAQRATRR